jgi:hypothetical protein
VKTPLTRLERRIRLSALLVFLALAATLASLLIFHPLSFVGFAVFGVTIIIIANVYFLYAVLRGNRGSRKESSMTATPPVGTQPAATPAG